MELIKEIARNIILIVFFAGVLEIFLPVRTSVGKYLQLVMGLFVIITIISPIVKYFDQNTFLETLTDAVQQTKSNDIIFQQGVELKKQNESLAVQSAVEKIQKQATALAQLVPGVDKAEAKVDIYQDGQTLQLKSIKVFASVEELETSQQSSEVETVSVDLKTNEKKDAHVSSQKTKQLLVETIAGFYSLRPEQVQIVIK
ncbi:stage III sporulation protein AF [Bacillota bacterium LX-D]|nr:stage III sporulation protein AF [Bacillota bacterium LX-D]